MFSLKGAVYSLTIGTFLLTIGGMFVFGADIVNILYYISLMFLYFKIKT